MRASFGTLPPSITILPISWPDAGKVSLTLVSPVFALTPCCPHSCPAVRPRIAQTLY
jgi:hypothetical protein